MSIIKISPDINIYQDRFYQNFSTDTLVSIRTSFQSCLEVKSVYPVDIEILVKNSIICSPVTKTTSISYISNSVTDLHIFVEEF